MARLVARGHVVRVLVRRGSEGKVPRGAEVVTGNVFDSGTCAGMVAPANTFVHLVGTPHRGPLKAAEFLTDEGLPGGPCRG